MQAVKLVLLLIAVAACSSSPTARPRTFGGDRPVDLEVPTPFDESKHYPLILVLHGYGASGFVQEALFGVNSLPKAGEAFVLAPDGNVDSMGHEFWNADPACCDFDHTMPDDVGYLGGLIDDVSAAWPVDRGAIYVMGHSNGGYMAYRLACDRADVITNIMVLAGVSVSDPSTCHPAAPVAVLHLHGTVDDMVPYSTAAGSVASWAALDGCGTTQTAGPALDLDTSLPGAETQTTSYDGCPPGIAVELWTIQGAGHIPDFDQTTFAPLILQYFQAHGRDIH
jgi:polyhydroxybutyrate depolymerase